MTIAKAFNEIAVAQGGTADTSGTIAGAIDAVNDALAGSDLPKKPRIEDGIRVLGQYIGGGGLDGAGLIYISIVDAVLTFHILSGDKAIVQVTAYADEPYSVLAGLKIAVETASIGDFSVEYSENGTTSTLTPSGTTEIYGEEFTVFDIPAYISEEANQYITFTYIS